MQLPATCKSITTTTYNSPAKCVLKCLYPHLHALWAQLEHRGVFHGYSPFVCVCIRLSDAHCFSRPSGPVTPKPPHQPVNSPPLLLLLVLLLSLSLSLLANEWSPGDEVTVLVTAQSLFLSRGIRKVLYFARETTLQRRSLQVVDGDPFILFIKRTLLSYVSITSHQRVYEGCRCEAAGYGELCFE